MRTLSIFLIQRLHHHQWEPVVGQSVLSNEARTRFENDQDQSFILDGL